MKLINSLKYVKESISRYNEWDKNQKDLEARRELLSQTNPVSEHDLKFADSYGRTVIDNVNALDEYIKAKEVGVDTFLYQITNKSGDIGLLAGVLSSLPILGMIKHKNMNVKKLAVPVVVSTSVLGNIIGTSVGTIWGIKAHRQVSDIAKSEAMHTIFKDPKNFIVYTPEQIQQAEELAKTIDLPPDKYKNPVDPASGLSECIKAVKSTIKNKNILYERQSQNYIEELIEKKLSDAEVTPQMLDDAKKSQDVLFRVMKKLDLTSQEYGENVTMGLNIAVIGTILGGFASGKVIENVTGALQKSGKIAVNSKPANIIKKIASPVLTLGLGLFSSFYTLSLQKEATSVGRFVAKRELTKNPYNFVAYSDEELNKVKPKDQENTAPLTFKQKFVNLVKDTISDLKALCEYRKDLKEYKEYKNSGELHDRKVREAFKQIEVTEKQLHDAKILQKRVFKTFDCMDKKCESIDNIDIYKPIFKSTLLALSSIPAVAVFSKELMKLPEIKNLKNIKSIDKKLILVVSKKALDMGNNITLAIILPLTLYEIFSTKVTKLAAKISVMDSLQNLNDPRNYVEYTDEQYNEAEKQVKEELKNGSAYKHKPGRIIKMKEFLDIAKIALNFK